MGDLSARNFGLLIAYLLPGFVVLCGAASVSEPVKLWLLGAGQGPNVGSALYVLLGSTAAGMTANAVRWVVIDTLHHSTGLRRPKLQFGALAEKLEAFDRITEWHYRYYQCYANGAVSTAFSFTLWRRSTPQTSITLDLGVVLLSIVFIAASRDALQKFYARAAQLLGNEESLHERNGSSRTDHGNGEQALKEAQGDGKGAGEAGEQEEAAGLVERDRASEREGGPLIPGSENEE